MVGMENADDRTKADFIRPQVTVTASRGFSSVAGLLRLDLDLSGWILALFERHRQNTFVEFC
jgi:hypothetical protein